MMTDTGSHDGSHLTTEQRDALWKWRWLGLRDSTPAFKASLVLLAAIAFALATYLVVIGLP
jgi:hypothetical protein